MLTRTLGVTCLSLGLLLAFRAGDVGAAVVAKYDLLQHQTNGFAFGDFNDFDALDTSGDLGDFIRLTASEDLDASNGIYGGIGSDIAADMNAASSQLEVTLRVDPSNEASNFRVILADSDGPNSGDEFQFYVDISGVTPGDWVTLTQPLLNPGPVFVQPGFGLDPGDEIQNYGLTQIQIQSEFGGTAPLYIDVESVKINDTDNPVLIELTPATFAAQPQSFTYGTFSEEGVVDDSGGTFIINHDPEGTGGPDGGLGFNGLNIDFEATQYQLEVEARLLGANTAEVFNLLMGDEDGDDSGPGVGSEDYNFDVLTSAFGTEEFSTYVIPLGSGSESSIVTTFGFENGGDELQNFGLSQLQIQSTEGETGVLNIEIVRMSVVERTEGIPGDYNGNGQVEQGDLDLVLLNWGQPAEPAPEGWVNDLPEPDIIDQEELDGVLLHWGESAAATFTTAVPEPTSMVLLGGLLLGLGLQRRRSEMA